MTFASSGSTPEFFESEFDRDRLVSAMYEAAADAGAYVEFIDVLRRYLEATVLNSWNIEHFETLEIGAFLSDQGLARHFDRMNRILLQKAGHHLAGGLHARVAERRGVAVLIDRSGAIVARSAAASQLLGTARPSIDALARQLYADDERAFRSCVASYEKDGSDVALRIFRGDNFHLAARTVHSAVEQQLYLIVDTLQVEWSKTLEASLHASFALTPAELRVLRALALGRNVSEIAEASGRSVGTVRNQAKSVLSKTNAGTLANLNRLVALIAGNVATHATEDARPEQEVDMLTLPDGRALEVRLQGPKHGRPVLYIHGQLFGTELPPEGQLALNRNGLRLIAPSRPNFGLSDPVPPTNAAQEPDRLVQDIAFLLDHYGIGKLPLLSFAAGTVYGYSLAAAMPDRFTGLVHAGAILPALTVGQFAKMPPTQRTICFLMRFAPEMAPPLFRAGLQQIEAQGETEFLRTLFKDGARDRAVVDRPDLADFLRRSIHFGTRQSYFGVFTDSVQIVTDWSQYVEKVAAAGVPSLHIHGTADLATRISDVRRFVDRFPGITLEEVDGGGQLLVFDTPGLLLDRVAEFC
ncbi:alpha/beta fold hydrolase [Tropicimonas isoalkanivorans]|uniref:Pimeloyl-ACP methyl ester carboxylesterase n=1 Tax=Tropicimonas isoalkanivorans TaxID=441112 RepID=A0A1I1MN30_9RHOB|nr:alpha/beta fold hydrolase [Tropicimonas isoalkanivorans]SFC86819.1 Pimeloyl-ACP methyl ester carboxylesterase [Tropicimonas isoalkanivorans]